MDAQLKPSELLEEVRVALNCSQSYLCRKLSLKTLDFSTPEYTKRITLIYNICKPYIDKYTRGEELFQILETHVFEDHLGQMDSVLSALIQDKYSLEVLEYIADLAYKRMLSRH